MSFRNHLRLTCQSRTHKTFTYRTPAPIICSKAGHGKLLSKTDDAGGEATYFGLPSIKINVVELSPVIRKDKDYRLSETIQLGNSTLDGLTQSLSLYRSGNS